MEHTAYIRFLGRIEEQTTKAIYSTCLRKVHEGATQIYLALKSPGGDAVSGQRLYLDLKALPVSLITHGRTAVESAAVYPFLAGTQRYMEPNGKFLLHPIQWGSDEGVDPEIKNSLSGAQVIIEQGKVNILMQELTANRGDILELLSKESILETDDAIRLGMIQDVREISIPPNSDLTDLFFKE